MTIFNSGLVDVGQGAVMASSPAYLYTTINVVGANGGLIYRSNNNGIDWESDSSVYTLLNGAAIITLLENDSHIVLVSNVKTACFILDKTGTTWSAITGLTAGDILTGAHYVNGTFFIFFQNYYYTSTNGSTWTQRTVPSSQYYLIDVTHDGTYYYFLCSGNRIYRTSNFSSYSGYVMSDAYGSAKTIFYRAGYFLFATNIVDSSVSIYSTTDLITYTSSPLSLACFPYSARARFFVVDGVLFIALGGGEDSLKGKYYRIIDLESWNYEIAASDVPSASYAMNSNRMFAFYIYGEYIFVPGGELYRALYNEDWTSAEGVLSAITDGLSSVITGAYNPSTAVIQGTLRLDTSDGPFAARKVYLYNYTTGALVAETTSDGTLGTWEFTAVAPGDYFVVGAATSDDYVTFNRDFDALGVITVV